MRRIAAILSLTALALVMAPPAAAGGGCHWETAEWTAQSSSAAEVTAHIAGCRYEPTTLEVELGTTVTWLNKDPVPHSVTGPFLTLNGDALLNQGESASVTFDEEGVYPYYCVLHPGMAASVIVGHPKAANEGAVGATGTYEGDKPIEGASSEEAAANDTSVMPIAAGAAAVTLAIGGAAFLVRRRRRVLPVPTAMP